MTNILTKRIAFLILLMTATALPSLGQGARLELKNLESLKSKANESTDVSLDGSMLQLATKALENEKDADAAKIKDLISKLKGVYVKTFEFKEKNQYSNSDLEPIRVQLKDPNWSKIVDVQESGESTEIYLMKEGESLIGVALLVAEPQELTVVNIVGPIELDKLGELAGKFGGMMGKFDIGPDGLKLRGKPGTKGSTAKPTSGKASAPAKATTPAPTPSKPNNQED